MEVDMNKYYCVNAEFYDSREVKACMTEKQAEEKPRNQFKRVYGLTAFKIWVATKEFAEKLTEGIKCGGLNIDIIISLFDTLTNWEKPKKAYNDFQDWLNRRAA
jgi:hypothetical protein